MKLNSLFAVLILISACPALGGKTLKLKPDRTFSITGIEHHAGKTSKEYRVSGTASLHGKSTPLYYELACGTAAADLEVGHTYNAAEVQVDKIKQLVIWWDESPPDAEGFGLGCEVESVKSPDTKRN